MRAAHHAARCRPLHGRSPRGCRRYYQAAQTQRSDVVAIFASTERGPTACARLSGVKRAHLIHDRVSHIGPVLFRRENSSNPNNAVGTIGPDYVTTNRHPRQGGYV
jgi:hypothetical protein